MIFSADDPFNQWNTRLHHSNLWPANSADINPVDYWIWRSCKSVCTAARSMTSSPSWSRVWSKSCTISTRWSSISSQAVAFTSSSLHSSMRRICWTQTLICLIFALWQSHLSDLANSGHFLFLSDLAKLAITTADNDRFYWNLVICMPFDVALLFWNFVKILHCLW